MDYSLPTESQRYDRYEARIRRLGRHLDRIRRHPILTAGIVLVLVLGIVVFLLSIGSFSGDTHCEDLVYGDTPQCSVNAFLSKISFQYAQAEGEPVWSDRLPTTTGTYRIRAVSKNGFGQLRYSEAMTFTLLPRPLEVQIHDGTFVYGDFSMDIPKSSTEILGLAQGDCVAVVEYISEENSNGNQSVSLKSIEIQNHYGENVTSCYRITSWEGHFTMTPRPITITGNSAEKIYDGKPWDQATGALTAGTLAEGDRLEVHYGPVSADAGVHPLLPQCTIHNASGEDITSRYQIHSEGTLTVHPRPLSLQTPDATKEYDGKPLTNERWGITEGEIVSGHALSVVVTGSQTNAGESPNTVEVSVTDSDGNDVTKNYKLSVKKGTLTVTPIVLRFKTDSSTKVYNGQPLKAKGWDRLSGKLLQGHTLSCQTTGSQTNVGTSENTFSAVVLDANQTDVTAAGYRIEVDQGKLTVTPRPLKIISESAEKPYDGTPLICHVFRLEEDSFRLGSYGQRIQQSNFTGVQIEVGSSANTFTVVICDQDSKDTTSNYDITYVYGTLTVTPAQGGSTTTPGGSAGIPPIGTDTSIDFPSNGEKILYATIDSIYGSGQLYFRSSSYGDYTGTGWKAPTEYRSDLISPLEFLGFNRRDNMSIHIDLINDCPILLSYYTTPTVFSHSVKTDSYFYKETDTYSLDLTTGYTYQELKKLQVDPAIADLEQEYRKFVYKEYLQIPESTKTALLQWAKENGIRAASSTLAEDIQNAVKRSGTYNLNGKPYPAGADVAVYFLTEAKEGVCGHYATAATMLYRAFGIPARYTVGFVSNVEEGRTTYLTSDNAHAWVEIYVDGLGWVPMEVTGSSFDPTDTKINLHVGAYSATKSYDGKGFSAFDLQQYSILSGKLMDGHRLEVTFVKGFDPVAPGKYQNLISRCTIYDENGTDVTTKYYNVYTIAGTLNILPRQITVTMGSATKVYDGKELTCSDYWVSQGSLVPNHELQISTESVIQDVGTVSNEPSTIHIWGKDSNGRKIDVTDYYAIEIISGTLKITSP